MMNVADESKPKASTVTAMPKRELVVSIEYPVGEAVVTVELEDREYTDAELSELADDAFREVCSYGYRVTTYE